MCLVARKNSLKLKRKQKFKIEKSLPNIASCKPITQKQLTSIELSIARH